MPAFSPELSTEELTLLLCAIVWALIPLSIWLFWDLERRRRRAIVSRGRLSPLRQKL